MKFIGYRRYDLDGCRAHDSLWQLDEDTYRLIYRCIGHPTEPAEYTKELSAMQAADWMSEEGGPMLLPRQATVLLFVKGQQKKTFTKRLANISLA